MWQLFSAANNKTGFDIKEKLTSKLNEKLCYTLIFISIAITQAYKSLLE